MSDTMRPLKAPTKLHMRADRVRLTVFFYKKDGLSLEDFSQHWSQEHSSLVANCPIVKKNLLSYEQAHTSSEGAKKLESLGFKMAMADYDGVATFDATSFEKIAEVFADKQFQEEVMGDGKEIFALEKIKAVPSTIATVFDDPS